MSGDDELPNPSTGSGSLLSGRRKWAGVGAIVLVVAIVGLGLTLFLDGAGVTPVIAIVIAVIGGAAIAIWLVEAQP